MGLSAKNRWASSKTGAGGICILKNKQWLWGQAVQGEVQMLNASRKKCLQPGMGPSEKSKDLKAKDETAIY